PFRHNSPHLFRDFTELLDLPTLRTPAEPGVDELHVLVAREPEVVEPFAINGAGHLLEDLNSLLVVRDEVVVSSEGCRDVLLIGERRDVELHIRDSRWCRVTNLHTARGRADLLSNRSVIEQVVEKM